MRIEFDSELDDVEPGLSADEVFERFAREESPKCEFDIRLYRRWIMKDAHIGSQDSAQTEK